MMHDSTSDCVVPLRILIPVVPLKLKVELDTSEMQPLPEENPLVRFMSDLTPSIETTTPATVFATEMPEPALFSMIEFLIETCWLPVTAAVSATLIPFEPQPKMLQFSTIRPFPPINLMPSSPALP